MKKDKDPVTVGKRIKPKNSLHSVKRQLRISFSFFLKHFGFFVSGKLCWKTFLKNNGVEVDENLQNNILKKK